MKKILILICAVLMSVCLCGCDSDSENGPTNEEYFAITELIQKGEYEQAKTALDETYAQTDYGSGSAGFNKMNQYRLYYLSQNLYDDAMTVLLDFLKANDFVNHLKQVPADTNALEDNCVYAIVQVKNVLELASDEKRTEAVELIGQELLDKYGADNAPKETIPAEEGGIIASTEPTEPAVTTPATTEPNQNEDSNNRTAQERLCYVRIYIRYNGAVLIKPGITVYLDDIKLGELEKSGLVAGSTAIFYAVTTVGEHTVKVVDNDGTEAEKEMTVLDKDYGALWGFEYVRPNFYKTTSFSDLNSTAIEHSSAIIPHRIDDGTYAYDDIIAQILNSEPEFYDDEQIITGFALRGLSDNDNYGRMFWYFFKNPSWYHAEGEDEVVFCGYAKRGGVEVPVEMTFLWSGDDAAVPELGIGFTRTGFTLSQTTVGGDALNYQQTKELLRSIENYYFNVDTQSNTVDNEAKELNY